MSRHPTDLPHAEAAAIAAHRFGLGEADLKTVGADALGWLKAQIGAAEPSAARAWPAAPRA